jgi:hypothetical protein
MLDEISGLGVYNFLGFFILGVKLGIEDVLSDDDADGVEDAIERVDVVGHLREVVLHEEEREMRDGLRDDLQTADGLLGQLVEAVVAEALPVGLAQVQQVVLAETAPPLAVPHPQLQVAGHLRPEQRAEGCLLILLARLLRGLLLIKQVILQDVDFTLREDGFRLLLDDWQFDLEKVLFLLLALLLPQLRPTDDLAGEGGLDLLAHLLADDGECFDDDLQVLSGEEVVDDDVLGQLLVVVLGLEDLDDELEGVDVVVLGEEAGVGGADVALGRLQGVVDLGGVALLEVLAEVVPSVDPYRVLLLAVVDAALLHRLHPPHVFLQLPLQHLVVGREAKVVVDYELQLHPRETVTVLVHAHLRPIENSI